MDFLLPGSFGSRPGGSRSPNSLPSPLHSFVPRSCSAHLGASSPGGRHRAPRPRRLTSRLRGRCHPSPSGQRSPDTRSFPSAARTPPASLARRWPHQPSARVAPSGLSSQGWRGCVWLGNCNTEKRPPPPSPPPPQGRKGSLLVFDSCPKLHRPRSSRRRRQRLLTQGAGHRRKSIPDKNQLLPECAAAIDTRARRVPPFSSRGSSSNSDSGEGGQMRHTPQANVCSLGLKLRVPDWVARQFRNLTRCGHLSCSHAL